MRGTLALDGPQGRRVGWLELGDAKDRAVFVFHGTPGSSVQVSSDDGPIRAARVRFIAVDRPGYGDSTFQRDRRLADWASDVARLADHLEIERFSVVGISGGGPHAAACARFLPDRIRAAGIVSGVGPLADPGSEDGMVIFNRLIVRLARRSHHLVYPLFAVSGFIFRRWPEMALRAASGQMPIADVAIMDRPAVKSAYVESYRHASSTSARTAAQDFSLFTRDWGFRLEDITTPVHVWHGDDDQNVPISHGRLQAQRIPGARMHDCPGEGHLLILDRLEEILRTVTQADSPTS